MKVELMTKLGTLYKLTFPNGKSYVGITSKPLKARISGHISCSREVNNHLLSNAIRKYGEKSFVVTVLAVASYKDLLWMEVDAIRHHKTKQPLGYNTTDGGEVSPMLDPVVAAKVKGLRKNWHNPYRGSGHHSKMPKYRKLMSEIAKNRKFSLETRAKMSASRTGRFHSEESKRKISESKKGICTTSAAGIEALRKNNRMLDKGNALAHSAIMKKLWSEGYYKNRKRQ